MNRSKGNLEKSIFVTVGTTSFDDLISAVIEPDFLKVVKSKGYSKLLLQIGDGSITPEKISLPDIEVDYYDFKPSILKDIRYSSLVISHAGAGSILETLKLKKPLIVVVNEKLMDNHQIELAEAFHQMNNLYYCTPRSLLSIVKEKDISNLSPYTGGRPDIFGSYVSEFMGLTDSSTEKED